MKKLISIKDKIYLAGHTGMVGSAIKKILIENGYGDQTQGGEILIRTRSELNLLESNNVDKFFKKNKPNIVIVAAAKVGGIHANNTYPFEFISENLKIQQNIIESSYRNNVKRLLFLGSSCIYPKLSKQPINEEELLTKSLEETNEWYAIAKICGIKLCEALRKQYKFDAISLMPTNIYGPGDNYHPESSHVFASLIRKFIIAKKRGLDSVECWGTGSPYREFLHSYDLANACLFALERWNPFEKSSPKKENGEPFNFLNVGTGKDITIKELATLISREVDFKGKIIWDKKRPDGTPKKLLDISRFSSLGWEPKINLLEGIKDTIKDVYDKF